MPKTKRVRIAVVMAADGEWSCARVHDGDDEGAAGFAGEMLETDPREVAEHAVYVEADVPLPEATTVEGQVTD